MMNISTICTLCLVAAVCCGEGDVTLTGSLESFIQMSLCCSHSKHLHYKCNFNYASKIELYVIIHRVLHVPN